MTLNLGCLNTPSQRQIHCQDKKQGLFLIHKIPALKMKNSNRLRRNGMKTPTRRALAKLTREEIPGPVLVQGQSWGSHCGMKGDMNSTSGAGGGGGDTAPQSPVSRILEQARKLSRASTTSTSLCSAAMTWLSPTMLSVWTGHDPGAHRAPKWEIAKRRRA